MSLRGNLCLCHENLVADGAVLALGQSGLRAGGSDCLVDDLGVPLRGNLLHAGENCVTLRALGTGFVSGHSAGCGLFSNINGSMPGCIKCLGLGFVANGTSVRPDTRVFAGGRSRDLAAIPTVSRCRNLRLLDQHLVTDRAMLAFGLAGLGAGGFHRRVDDLGVPLCGNHFLSNKNLVADGAVLALGLSGFGAGGLNCRVDDLGVPLRGNLCLCHENLIADGAVLALGQSGLCAGGGDCLVDDLGVPLRGNHFTAADLITALPAVGVAGVTGSGTGGVLRIANLRIGMAAGNSKLCSVRGVAGNSSNGLIPAAKRIGVHVVIRTGRRHAAIDGHRSIFLCRAIQLRAVPVQPPDCVGAQFLLIHGSILRVAHYRNRLRCPADKAIGILRISRTGRRHATIDGRRSIFLCRAIQLRAVPVFPGDGSLIGGGANHTSLLVKAVTTLLHQAIGCFYPIGAVLDHGTAGLVLEIVVVAFHVAQTGLNIFNTVLYPVDIALPWVETVHMLLQNAVCAKHVDNIFATFVHGVETGSSVFAGSEVIPVSVHGVPLLRRPGTCPHILGSRAVSDQITANQDTVFECVVIVADGLLSVHSGIVPRIEEVILYSTAGMRD